MRFIKIWRLIPAGTAWTSQTGPPNRSDRSDQADKPVAGKNPLSSLNLYETWEIYFAEYFYQYK